MPWANGQSATIEILCQQSKTSGFLWRRSMTTVSQNGALSPFPSIAPNLTMIVSPGCDLVDGTPVAATNVTGTATIST
jgi:environmental stress-induced protein Ves